MIKYTCLIIAMSFIFIGCSNSKISRNGVTENTEIIISSNKEVKPEWIRSFSEEKNNYKGYILAVGMTSSTGEEYSPKELEEKAYRDGKNKLSEYLGTEVRTDFNSEKEENNGEMAYETITEKSEQRSNNIIEEVLPLDSYFEKVKLYRNKKWETIYNYYVLYGMPDKSYKGEKIIVKRYKKLDKEKIQDSKEAVKTYQKMEDLIEEMNRSGYYINGNFGIIGMETAGFAANRNDIKIKQDDIKNSYIVNVEMGKEINNTYIYTIGGIYANSPLNIYSGGIGVGRKILRFDKFLIKIQGDATVVLADGEIAELSEDSTFGTETYRAGSKIRARGITYGITPSLKAEYRVSKLSSVFLQCGYSMYSKLNNMDLTIEDKLNSSKNSDIAISGYSPELMAGGLILKSGIQFNF